MGYACLTRAIPSKAEARLTADHIWETELGVRRREPVSWKVLWGVNRGHDIFTP